MTLALRLLWRDWRSGELRILAAALVMAIAIVTAIGLFVDRLQTGIEAQSRHFLAADRVLSSSRPIAPAWLQQAQQWQLAQARVISFSSMVYVDQGADTAMQLAAVKAVSAEYPLRGYLEVADRAFGEPDIVHHGPAAGEIWVDSRLLPLLDIDVGDSLYVGEAQLTVTRALLNEPDRGSSLTGIGPRVMMNTGDLAATGIIQPGSRVQYRYLFAGEEAALERFSRWLKPQLLPAQRWITVKDNRPRLARSLDRAEQFLMLAGAVGVGLAGVAIALAAHRYSQRHYDYVAMMKSLGASRRRIVTLYLGHLLVLSVAALLLGLLIGWGLQASVISSLSDFFSLTAVPALTLRPLLVAAVTSLVCLLAFALPPLVRMSGAPPLRVLRRDIQPFESGAGSSIAIGVAGIAALMWWYSRDWKLTLAVLAATVATLVVMAGVVWLLLRSARTPGMHAGSMLRLALSAVRRRGLANAVQVVIFALSLMLLLTLVATRTTLIEDWKVQIPEGTPNHFVINIGPDRVRAFESLLAQEGIRSEVLYPMVRGRLVAVNGDSVRERLLQYDPDSGGEGLQRELNLTWSAQLPEDNELVAGSWWQADSEVAELSIEQGLAQRLGVKPGDQLRFALGAQELQATVSSIRSLQWDSMKPNFFIVMPKSALQAYPETYITSFYLSPQQKRFLNQLIRAFPTVTVIEMDQVLEQIRSIVDRVSSAVEWVLSLVVVSAVLVLLASVQSSLDTRFRESAILRTLGAKRRLVLGSLVLEFGSLGVLAGLIAALSAEIALFLLQTEVLQMDYRMQPWMWLAGPLLGAVIIGGAGYASCRRVVNTPPMSIIHTVG